MLPSFADDEPTQSLREAIDRDLEALRRRPEATITLGETRCEPEAFRAALARLRDLPAGALAAEIAERFDVYRARSGRVTGYYEPVVRGRRESGGEFVYPLYRRPDDLVDVDLARFSGEWTGRRIAGRVVDGRLEPYFARREIDGEGRLGSRGLELVWVDDAVARFFLHVQGSGLVDLGGGHSIRVGFAGSNGRPYTSIGQRLLEERALPDGRASAPAIQRWLREHPERRDDLLFRNERYVFFRETREGPVGSLGATLTAGRSIAVDPSLYPLGVLAWIETQEPVLDAAGDATGSTVVGRFVLAQDTGAAITGPGRVDLFYGTGDQAGRIAGQMSAPGTLYLLMPRCERAS